MSDNNKNYYEILKVSPLASPSAIKKSYQSLARVYHPDKNPGDPSAVETFKQINKAYQVLSNTFARKDFDKKLKEEKQKQEDRSFSPMYESYHSYSSLSDKAPQAGGAPSSSPPFAQAPPPHSQAPPSPLQSVKDYFYKTKNPADWQKICGRIELSLEEATRGGVKKITLQILKNKKLKSESFSVKVPPGARSGHTLPIKPAGTKNLFVSVVHKPHPLFKLQEEHILMDLPVPFTKAILGGEVEIPTLRGKVSFQLPAGVHAGHTIQLKGQGFPSLKNLKKRGNMLVSIVIDIPSSFTEEEKTWIKNIQKRNYLCPKPAEFDIKAKLLLKKRKS